VKRFAEGLAQTASPLPRALRLSRKNLAGCDRGTYAASGYSEKKSRSTTNRSAALLQRSNIERRTQIGNDHISHDTFPSTRHQRCWLHKTLNVLDKFPKSVQPNAHKDLREISLAPDRATAETAIAAFAEKYAPKYDKAVECLIKDRETLLTFPLITGAIYERRIPLKAYSRRSGIAQSA